MNQSFRALTYVFGFAMLAALSNDAVARTRHKQVQRPRGADATVGAAHTRNSAKKTGHAARVAAARHKSSPSHDRPAPTVEASALSGDLAAVKQAIDLVRKVKTGEATVVKNTIGDPVAQKLVEWLILRHPSGDAGFGRYAAFIADNPNWPGIGLLRRRAAEVVGTRARLTMPPLELCTDNAAMIAAAGSLGGRPPADVDPSLGWQ